MTKLFNTTRIQLSSLDRFAAELGYDYNGKYFENDSGNKVKFSRMVSLHNGYFYNANDLRVYKHKQPIRIGNEYVDFDVVKEARNTCIVECVKLQQKKNGKIVTQSHIIETVV